VLAIDFGTATTFNVVDRQGRFIGGVIVPGLAVMTDYLHEKTALLPPIKWRETDRVIGRSTTQAIRAGVVRGYRGLVRELILDIGRELRCPRLPVVATGGNAARLAAQLPEIRLVHPHLTLEGLRLDWFLSLSAHPKVPTA
jgi:type III pantothenate kinase